MTIVDQSMLDKLQGALNVLAALRVDEQEVAEAADRLGGLRLRRITAESQLKMLVQEMLDESLEPADPIARDPSKATAERVTRSELLVALHRVMGDKPFSSADMVFHAAAQGPVQVLCHVLDPRVGDLDGGPGWPITSRTAREILMSMEGHRLGDFELTRFLDNARKKTKKGPLWRIQDRAKKPYAATPRGALTLLVLAHWGTKPFTAADLVQGIKEHTGLREAVLRFVSLLPDPPRRGVTTVKSATLLLVQLVGFPCRGYVLREVPSKDRQRRWAVGRKPGARRRR